MRDAEYNIWSTRQPAADISLHVLACPPFPPTTNDSSISQEQWQEMGKPRNDPWEPGVIKRHCGVANDNELREKLKEKNSQQIVTYGKIGNYEECACEFGLYDVPSFLNSRFNYEECRPFLGH